MKNNQKAPFTRVVLALLVLLLSAASAWAVSLSDFDPSGSNTYLIKTGDDLKNLATYVNAGNTTKGITFKLNANITAAGTYIPVGNPNHVFNGTFDGNGKTIRVYYKYDPTPTKVTVGTGYSYELTAGVFGVLGSSAVVKNLTVEQPAYSLVSTQSQTGFQMSSADFGGIAGINNGQIIDCTADNNSFTVEVDATTNSVGGIVGTNKGTIKNTTSSYILTTNLKSGASNYVGGIAGYNTGTIEANTTESYITNNGGDAYIGGIVGFNAGTATKNFVSSYKKNSGSKGKGAIAGYNNKTLTQNGYYNLGTGIGTGSGDVTSSSGAIPVYKITAGTGVSVSGATTFTRYDVKYYAYNSTITLSATSGNNPKTGYTIGYSADNGNITVSSSGTFTMPAKDISVARADKPINYTITYYLNGGSNPSGTVSTYTIEKAVTLPTPTKSGYTFAGWFTSSNFSGSKVTTIAKGSTGNRTFYAKWNATSYTITYKLDGGTNPSNAPTSYTAQSADITLPNPTKTGYAFAGWYTSSSFTGSKVTKITSGSSGNKTFYAKWTAITYNVVFNSNDGTNRTASQKFTYGTAQKLDANSFEPTTGKGEFIEWTTKANGTGTKYKDQESVTNLATTLGETVNLYAQWKKHIANANNIYIYDIEDETWTGKAITPSVIIIENGSLDITDEFDITYSDNTEVGLATVTITVKSTNAVYSGSITKTFKIVKATPSITAPQAKTLTYNGKAQALVTEGSTSHGILEYSLDGKNYSTVIPTAINAGDYTVCYLVEGDEHFNTVHNCIEVTIKGTYTKNSFVEVNEVNGKKYAVIDGNNTSDEPFEITEDFEAENIQLTREFTVGEGYSTLVLPFEVETSKLSGVDNILKFVGIGVNEKNVKQVEMTTVWEKGKSNVKLEANKPYMVKMSSPALEVTGAVTFKATTTPIEEHNGWTFVGTYKFKEWTETSDELGRAYGFAGQSNDEVSAGQFVKVAAGAYINPMRAYLLAPAPVAKAKSANNVSATASINNLPEKIDMVIVDGEQTTVIGTLYTRTGEIRWNNTKRTFDLKGRHVGKDNTARGAYYKKIEPKK